MDFSIPTKSEKLGKARLAFLESFKTACKRTMLEMLKTSQSGHPGGSLSMLDFLATLYVFRLSETRERIVVSNGHVSPAVYSVLAELGTIDKKKLIKTYRQNKSIFEGHITRHLPGIYYGTGPLGVGISVACGMALSEKMKNPKDPERVFGTLGDGECQEGQVHEAMLFASKYKLNNLTIFIDYNRVQLTASLDKTMPIDIPALFSAGKWNVIEIDGHNPEKIWEAINSSEKSKIPTVIVGKTFMGMGIKGMEEDGKKLKSTWHGQAPKPTVIDKMLKTLKLTPVEETALGEFRKERKYKLPKPEFTPSLKKMNLKTGDPVVYKAKDFTDCRSAYGQALLDLAKNNSNILAGTADLGGSVKTNGVEKNLPKQHIEYGIAEQNMVSCSGGLSLSDFIPFCSTFGAFMSSRAKDQARVNDINQTNVKMVSTHCGLSVGEDGPTHQAIDDMGSFAGFFNTRVIEPCDPNHCDRIIRYVANHYGNFYVRMGRHKLPVLTDKKGNPFFKKNYDYSYGQTDLLREGDMVTIVTSGPCVIEALRAVEKTGIKADIVIASSPKKFDDCLANSLKKTKKVIVVEDHNSLSGFGSAVALFAIEKRIMLKKFKSLSVKKYQLSGKSAELYHEANIDSDAIAKELKKLK